MLLNIPCGLSHYSSLKLYMIYTGRDYKSCVSFSDFSLVFCVQFTPFFFLHVNDVIKHVELRRLGHSLPVTSVTDKGRKGEIVLAENGSQSLSCSCLSLLQGYKCIHSSMISMSPKIAWLQ